jgi:hypothetical protein
MRELPAMRTRGLQPSKCRAQNGRREMSGSSPSWACSYHPAKSFGGLSKKLRSASTASVAATICLFDLRRLSTSEHAPQFDLNVTAGLAGYQNRRDRRYPGTHLLSATRFFAIACRGHKAHVADALAIVDGAPESGGSPVRA